MTISTQIPENWNLPLFWATVDGSMAGNVSEAQRALLVGQMFTSGGNTGNAVPGVAIPIGSAAQAGAAFGIGSMLYRMCVAFFAGNTTQQLWCLPVADGTAGQAATAKIIVTSNNNSGVISLYIAGQLVQCSVASTDASTAIATNLAAAINAMTTLPVTATVSTSIITLTCQWAGLTGNDIIIYPNYLGTNGGQAYPAGLSLQLSQVALSASAASATSVATISFASGTTAPVAAGVVAYDGSTLLGTVASVTATQVTLAANLASAVAQNDTITFFSTSYGQLTGGTGEPNFATAISNIQLLQFLYAGVPYGDAATLGAWANEYGFNSGGRWNYTRQQYGMILNARRDSYSNLITWGLQQNQPVISTMAIEPMVPSPTWEVTASYTGCAALGFSDDPARPLQTLELTGILPALTQYQFTQTMRNSLVNSGLAVQGVDASGNMEILVEQTQYQFNQYDQSDTGFGKLTVLATNAEVLTRLRSSITSKYPRVKLVPNGTKLGPGQAAVTPLTVQAELIAEYTSMEFDGLVSDIADFSANLDVEIDDNNPNKLDVLYAPQLAGQLRQFDALYQFRLMYPNNSNNVSTGVAT